jgi:alanine-glyoxylate transaminase/serine-glyoxylate transaminase/serine-pyruvate transaminase
MALEISRPTISSLNPPPRLLCGPGPCNAHPLVHSVLSLPQVGHLDPFFINVVQEIKDMLRYVWQTKNHFVIPVSGTGSAAMEACAANLIESGEKVLVFINGYFGERFAEMARRYGGDVAISRVPYGTGFTFDQIQNAVEQHKPKLLFLVHAETSTGVLQSVERIGELCQKHNILFVLDTVTSIAGIPIYLDKWGVDACYAGSQKCLSCPPGISVLTFSERGVQKFKNRKSAVPNWYLDMNLIAQYIVPNAQQARVYHHTAPISMVYALREALRLIVEEGLENCWERHRKNAEDLWKGLEDMGLECLVERSARLPSLTTVKVPEGVDTAAVLKYVLDVLHIELGGGLGELKGKVFRIGLMGYNSRKDVVMTVLSALKEGLEANGWKGKH